MLIDFLQIINKKNLFDQGSKLLLAHSGGKDSMALSHLLIKGGYKFSVAHCNFGLRGLESDHDQAFVSDFCERNNIEFFVKTFNTKEYAKTRGISTQMAARELRYEWFQSLVKDYKFDYLLTAHHLNDRLESLIFNITKGTGPKGLNPIPSKSGNLVRPLATFSLNQIHDFLKENKIEWREDSSNLTDNYSRNNLRHNVIPHLEKLNEGIWETQIRNLVRFEGLNEVFEEKLEDFSKLFEKEENTLRLRNFGNLKKTKGFGLLLEEFLKPYGFNYYQIQDIIDSEKTGSIFLSSNHQCLLERGDLILVIKDQDSSNLQTLIIENEGIYDFNGLGLEIKLIDIRQQRPDFKKSNSVFLSAEKLTFPLILRLWREGDKFIPFGLNGSKSISDYLTDIKVPSFQKKQQLVLVSGDQIAWLVGHRTSEIFKVSTSETRCFEIIFSK